MNYIKYYASASGGVDSAIVSGGYGDVGYIPYTEK